jgi:transposase
MTTTKWYLGMDVSKLWFDVSVLPVVNHVKQVMLSERFDNSKEGLKLFKKWLFSQGEVTSENCLIVIENTGVYHRLIWGFCSEQNLPLHIGNAANIKWSLGITRGKSDVIDSKRLCTYCYKQSDELKASAVLNPIFMQLKDLMTSRTRLLSQLNSIKKYIKELESSKDKSFYKVLVKSHKQAIDGINQSLQLIEAEITKIVDADDAIKRNYELLKSVPGIGHLTSVYIICCTNNFAGKMSGKQLASYAGVVPFEHSSGTSIKGKHRVHKMANKELKAMLHLGALTAIKYYAEFKDYFTRKKAEGKNGMLILNAIKNKLVLRAVSVVNKQQPYVDNYQKAA